MINKYKNHIYDTKKLMRKIGKRWVIVSTVLLGLLGGTYAVKVNADNTTQNNDAPQVTSAASNNPQSSSDDVMVFGASGSVSSATSSSDSISLASNSNVATLQAISKNLNSLDTNFTDYNSSYISSELGIDATTASSLANSISPQSSASVTSSSASSADSTSTESAFSSSASSSTSNSVSTSVSSSNNYITPVSSSAAKSKETAPSNATQPSVVKVAHKLLLHDNKHFTANNSVYSVYPGMTFQVINVVKDHRATRYVINYKGNNYFITASPRYVTKINNQTNHNKSYLYKSDFKKGRKMTVKTLTSICEYDNLRFSKRTLVKRVKSHKKLNVRKVVSMNNGKMTRLELTNHRYITANVKCVSVIK